MGDSVLFEFALWSYYLKQCEKGTLIAFFQRKVNVFKIWY